MKELFLVFLPCFKASDICHFHFISYYFFLFPFTHCVILKVGVLSTGAIGRGARFPDYYELRWFMMSPGYFTVAIFGPNAYEDAQIEKTTFCVDYLKYSVCNNRVLPGPGGGFYYSPLVTPSPNFHFIPPFPTPTQAVPVPVPSPALIPSSPPASSYAPTPYAFSGDLPLELEFVLRTENKELNYIRWMYYIHLDVEKESASGLHYVDLWICERYGTSDEVEHF